MKISLAEKLRKLAAFIELDTTPTEEEIHCRRGRRKGQVPDQVPVAKVEVQKEPEVVITPKIKPSRKELGGKWKGESGTKAMKEYMQEYRADGKHYETNSPKSKYVKKPQ